MDIIKIVQESFDELYGPLTTPVFLFDKNGNLTNANHSFSALTGARLEEIQSFSILSFLVKVLKDSTWNLKALPDKHFTEITNVSGQEIPVEANYIKFKEREGQFAGGLGFITDLQKIHATEARLKEVTIELEALKDQLAGEGPDRALRHRKKLEQEVKKANEFLENVLESCGDGIVITDGTGLITRVNKFFANMLGKKRKEVEGLYVYELTPSTGSFLSTTGETVELDQSYKDAQVGPMIKIFESGEEAHIENWQWYALHKNGNIVPVEASATFQKNAQGVLTGAVMSARDITARKRADKEIQTSKDFLENVLEACGDGIFIVDDTSQIIRVNKAFAAMLDQSKNELVGKYIYELGPHEGTFQATTGEMVTLGQSYREKRMQRIMNQFVQFEEAEDVKIHDWEMYAFHKTGDIVPLELTLTIQKSPDGILTGAVCSARDITERKKAEKALQEAYEFQKRFFTNITHEFRTPLTLSIGPAEGILRGEFGKITDKVREQLSMALRNSRQLLKLVNQLLDFSRLESGAKQLVQETKNLNTFIAAILDSFSLVARNKKIKLTFEPASDIGFVSIDPGKVEKVLFNLLGNAFKFTPEKGCITVTLEKVTDECTLENHIKISVADTGLGIKQAELESIFERFRQAGPHADQEQRGTGIGLAHARELVELMGGRITVLSTYGKGSTFTVYMPFKEAGIDKSSAALHKKEELYIQPEIELSDIEHSAEAVPESISGTKPLILIVDDNADVRRYVAGIVEQEYDFTTAASGTQGLKILQKHTPDVILCDVMMPEMDGYGFLKQVKATPRLEPIPFIFLTARADVEMKIEGLEAGADDYIVKPFNSLELLARVKSLLRIRTLLRKTAAQEKEIIHLTQKLQRKYRYGNIVGNSPAMRKIYQMIGTIKDSNANILITGETGTGKELIANAIHYNSPRQKGPMVSVNCGAIPRELMEREFFGHVKGAFTGAVESRKGYFAEADKGTLFLDEIGEMDKDMQVKLLRVLERGELTRVGDSRPTQIDVRLIAATNKNLLAEVQKGTFREDLYYRIHVVPIHLPPLRQRQEDIPLLIEHFMQEFKSKQKKDVPPFTEKDLRLFMNYDYPGNVRELQHIVERYGLLGGRVQNLFISHHEPPDDTATKVLAEELFSSRKPLKVAGQKAKSQAERAVLIKALELCDNDYVKTAKKLNICLASLYNKIKEYGITS